MLDSKGKPERIDHPGYGCCDAFYWATGKFNALRTCNTWAANWLRLAGVKTSLWPPFVQGLTWRYRRSALKLASSSASPSTLRPWQPPRDRLWSCRDETLVALAEARRAESLHEPCRCYDRRRLGRYRIDRSHDGAGLIVNRCALLDVRFSRGATWPLSRWFRRRRRAGGGGQCSGSRRPASFAVVARWSSSESCAGASVALAGRRLGVVCGSGCGRRWADAAV